MPMLKTNVLLDDGDACSVGDAVMVQTFARTGTVQPTHPGRA